jgi:hypothetical protein
MDIPLLPYIWLYPCRAARQLAIRIPSCYSSATVRLSRLLGPVEIRMSTKIKVSTLRLSDSDINTLKQASFDIFSEVRYRGGVFAVDRTERCDARYVVEDISGYNARHHME